MKKSKLLFLLTFTIYQLLRYNSFRKNPIWKGFLWESKRCKPEEGIGYWLSCPGEYVRYLRVRGWDLVERVIA